MRPRAGVLLAGILLAQWLAAFSLVGEVRLDADLLLLLPLALACVYAVATMLGGPRIGLFAAALWALAPFALVRLFDERYRAIYRDRFLAQAQGLAESSELHAAVALLVSAALVTRAVRGDGVVWGALAGGAAALACALDESAVLFAPAALLALLVARRPRALVPLAVGLLVGLLVAGAPPAPEDWSNLDTTQDGIREFFWSVRLLEWLPFAGVLGAARRSPAAAVLLGVWFGLYLVFRGTDPEVSIGAGTFFLAMLPALPAYVLLVAAIPLLMPPLPWAALAAWVASGRRVDRSSHTDERAEPVRPEGRRRKRRLADRYRRADRHEAAEPEDVLVAHTNAPVRDGARQQLGSVRSVNTHEPSSGPVGERR
jgi:hypothetical protein